MKDLISVESELKTKLPAIIERYFTFKYGFSGNPSQKERNRVEEEADIAMHVVIEALKIYESR